MRFAVLLLAPFLGLLAQRPAIMAVRNAASYTNSYGWGNLVSVFGTNLATHTETAATLPLPIALGGTTVKFGGVPAFLLYVSPTQINLQMPYFNTSEVRGTVEVITTNGSSGEWDREAAEPYWNRSGFGFFTADASGCGLAVGLNVDRATGATTPHSPANSVSPGEFLTLFGTGMGPYPLAPLPDGNASPLSPLYAAHLTPVYWSDFGNAAVDGGVRWFGKAPGLVGVDQVNLEVPSSVREGCAVPLQILSNGTSRPVTLAIRRGGGPCVDPPAVGYGEIAWERIEVANVGRQVTVEETLTASFQTSPGLRIPPLPAYTRPFFVTQFPFIDAITRDDRRMFQYFGPPCPIPGYRSLEAGRLVAEAPQLSIAAAAVPIPYAQVAGLKFYRAVVPPGTIQAGTYRVSAAGGADVPAFRSSLSIGSGIRVTSVRNPYNQPLVVEWTGGDADSWVTVIAVSGSAEDGQIASRRLQVRASNGAARIDKLPFDSLGIPEPVREIVVEVTPDPSRIVSFEVPGLAAVRHSWKYTYRFPQPVP